MASVTTQPSTPPAADSPPVCLVILNYNGRALLERFMPAFMKTDYQPLEVVVMDNASTDDSREWLRAHWPQVTVLHTPVNRAWPGGNNIAIRYALEKGHRYVVLANNDIEPHPAWIREAVNHARRHPACGVVGFALFNENVTRPDFEAACRKLGAVSAKPTENIVGCSMVCDSDVFRAIGLLDEDYVNYAEENDWEYRAMLAGWEMAEVSVPVWHLAEATLIRRPLHRCYLQMRSSIRFAFKLQGIFRGLCACKTVLNRACNPWLKLDMNDYTLRRYRPASLPVNAALAFAAIGWNLLALPATLRAGRKDLERIAQWRARKAIGQFEVGRDSVEPPLSQCKLDGVSPHPPLADSLPQKEGGRASRGLGNQP